MPKIASLLKEEMSRIARRECRALIAGLKKDSVRLKRDVAEHKKRLAELEKTVKRLIAETEPPKEGPAEDEIKKARITATVIRNLRGKLGLSWSQLAKLLGVSDQAVYSWEKKEGRINLRGKTKAAVIQARKLGKREAKRKLDEMGGD